MGRINLREYLLEERKNNMKKSDQIIIGVIVGIILLVLPFLFKKIIFLFTSEISVSVWLFSLLVILSFIFSLKILIKLKSLKYKGDIFYGIIWRWNYYPLGNVKNLTPYCLSCDTLLIYYDWQNKAHFKCDSFNCRWDKNFDESVLSIKNRIQREIERKVRKKEYIIKK